MNLHAGERRAAVACSLECHLLRLLAEACLSNVAMPGCTASASIRSLRWSNAAGVHDNIVGLRGLCSHGGELYLVMELCPRCAHGSRWPLVRRWEGHTGI